jgi:ubiquitin carboxyl-terminal hydrolase 16
MPDKPLTVATYAAGASLAAITLVYVFGPTFFMDSEAATTSASARKRGVVGLTNSANDCFINSVLQALAGLGELRRYLIREVHRRDLDRDTIYSLPVDESPRRDGKVINKRSREGMQKGLVTKAVKDMLDILNKRTIYKERVSAGPFIKALENAFNQQFNRSQQDAQEFLHIVAERLCEEYYAGRKARRKARQLALHPTQQGLDSNSTSGDNGIDAKSTEKDEADAANVGSQALEQTPNEPASHEMKDGKQDVQEGSDQKKDVKEEEEEEKAAAEEEDAFPLEGCEESIIECTFCHFKPKPTQNTFVTLTLHVPQVLSTTLAKCLDGHFQIEYIDDWKCEKCRLQMLLDLRQREWEKSISEMDRNSIQAEMTRIRAAMEKDPENIPKNIKIPENLKAPPRRIARHLRMTVFPKVLAIHLSRSTYDPRSLSSKNMAKVSFPEQLALGGLLDRKNYKLLGLVTHKGSHNSGHYEGLRRQYMPSPFATRNPFSYSGAYSGIPSHNPSVAPSHRVTALRPHKDGPNSSSASLDVDLDAPSPATESIPSLPSNSSEFTRDSIDSSTPSSKQAPTSVPRLSSSSSSRANGSIPGSRKTLQASTLKREKSSIISKAPSISDISRFKRKKKSNDRWWRISDDKIKESKTSDVLDMQQEVYLLFYELEADAE